MQSRITTPTLEAAPMRILELVLQEGSVFGGPWPGFLVGAAYLRVDALMCSAGILLESLRPILQRYLKADTRTDPAERFCFLKHQPQGTKSVHLESTGVPRSQEIAAPPPRTTIGA